MIILYDAVTEYCKKVQRKVPAHAEMNLMAIRILRELQKRENFVQPQKVEYKFSLMVNSYPDEAAELINKTIMEYFTNHGAFVRDIQNPQNKPKKIQFFNYDVAEASKEIFERALEAAGLAIMQNHLRNGKAQYKLPVEPCQLIRLGMAYQKLTAPVKRKRVAL